MEQSSTPKESKYRFVILAVYLVTSLVNSLPNNTFSGMNSTVEALFGISAVEVTLNTLMFPIAHTFFAYPCNWIINRYGIRISYFIAGGLVVGGAWLRTFLSEGNPYLCLLGSLTAAVGSIFLLNTASKLAFNWFRSELFPLITFVCVFANLLSLALSLIISGLIINSNSTKEDVLNFLRVEAAIVTVPFIFLLIFIRQKPETAPSRAAAIAEAQKRQKYTVIMKKLFSNRQYLKIAVAMAFNYGINMAFFSIQEQALKGLGYQDSGKVISTMGLAGIVFGVIGNYVYSTILRKTKAYKYTAAAINFGSFAGYVLLVLGFLDHANKTVTIALLSIMFGFNYLSCPSSFILFAAEAAFPIDQASVAGYLFAFSQTFGFVAGLICAAFLNKTQFRSQMVFGVLGFFLFISFIVVLTTKQDLKKSKFQTSLLKDVEDVAIEKSQSLVTDENIQ